MRIIKKEDFDQFPPSFVSNKGLLVYKLEDIDYISIRDLNQKVKKSVPFLLVVMGGAMDSHGIYIQGDHNISTDILVPIMFFNKYPNLFYIAG